MVGKLKVLFLSTLITVVLGGTSKMLQEASKINRYHRIKDPSNNSNNHVDESIFGERFSYVLPQIIISIILFFIREIIYVI